jgi:hypothetical protein
MMATKVLHKLYRLLQLLPEFYVTITTACDNKVSSVGGTEKCGLFTSTSRVSTILLQRMEIGHRVDSQLFWVVGNVFPKIIGNPR